MNGMTAYYLSVIGISLLITLALVSLKNFIMSIIDKIFAYKIERWLIRYDESTVDIMYYKYLTEEVLPHSKLIRDIYNHRFNSEYEKIDYNDLLPIADIVNSNVKVFLTKPYENSEDFIVDENKRKLLKEFKEWELYTLIKQRFYQVTGDEIHKIKEEK